MTDTDGAYDTLKAIMDRRISTIRKRAQLGRPLTQNEALYLLSRIDELERDKVEAAKGMLNQLAACEQQREWLNGRDQWIVDQGLWEQFVKDLRR